MAFKTGWACHEAAQDVKRQMIQRAAMLWEAEDDDVELVDGVFRHRSDPELSMDFQRTRGPAPGYRGPRGWQGQHGPGRAGAAPSRPTSWTWRSTRYGQDHHLLRYTAVQDAGKAIHPSYVEGQIQGGVVQGIGWALNEEYYMDSDGRLANSSLLDYRMPTSLDLPMIDTVIVEVPNPSHPYGVRGVAEVPAGPAHGGNSQRHLRRRRGADDQPANEPRRRLEGNRRGQRQVRRTALGLGV